MAKISVSIIIPNYNTRELLKKNLAKVIKEGYEIIVVDDASTDGSVEELRKLKGKIKLITNKKNLGFSSTVNRGVKAAKGEIVILLNTDVYPEKGFLKPVLPHFQDSQVFAVGLMDKSIENGKVVLRGRGVGEWKRGFYVHRRGEVDKKDTAWVSGGSGAFRKSIFLALGGFAPIYNPFYWEDIDLSYRAVKVGYKILFEPKSIVIHEHEKGAIRQRFSEKQMKLIAFRNQFLFVWRNAKLKQWLSHLFWLPYHLIFTALRTRGLFLLALLCALTKLPEVRIGSNLGG